MLEQVLVDQLLAAANEFREEGADAMQVQCKRDTSMIQVAC
jgi:hypothetical protein